MGSAEIFCGQCGKELSAESLYCSQCGTKIEPAGGPQPLVRPEAKDNSCPACGHVNLHDDPHCESCGAKLPGRRFHNVPSSSLPRQAKSRPKAPGSRVSAKGSLEPWHYAVGAMIVAIAGVFMYMETRRAEAPAVTQQPPLMQFPSGQNPSSPPGQEMLNAIERLEKTVRDNPNDAGSKLLLANALHDAGTHDAKYLPRAIAAYKAFLKVNPNDPNARVDLGICYFEVGKTDSTHAGELFANAVKEMEAALKTDPKHQAGAFNLGIVQLYSGNIQESNKWFQKAVALNPESDLGKRAKTILEQHSRQL